MGIRPHAGADRVAAVRVDDVGVAPTVVRVVAKIGLPDAQSG